MAEYTYSAFISYRHTAADQSVAKRIQKSIETYTIPEELRGDSNRKRFLKVFRDSDELGLNRDLASEIDGALAKSEFLIVILSPLYKESKWCVHEIEEFLKTHDRSQILCVLAEGTPREVFPDVLTNIPAEDGSGTIIYKEPLCADYRLDRTTADKLELPRLLCSMLHCPYDDMVKRHELYRRKQLMKLAAAVLAVVATIIGLQIHNLNSLNRAYQETLYNQSRTLATQSLQNLSNFDRQRAIADAIDALPSSEKDERPVTTEAVYALAKATYAYRRSAFAQTKKRSMQYGIINCSITPELHRIVTMDEYGWILVQSDKGERISNWQIDGTSLTFYGFTIQDEYTILAWRGGNLYSYAYENRERNWALSIDDSIGTYDGMGIYGTELIDSSSCSVLTDSHATIVDLKDGTIRDRLLVSDIIAALLSDPENDTLKKAINDMPGTDAPDLELLRQYITSEGEVILTGSLQVPDKSFRLCITVWNPETDALRAYAYNLPSYCAGLELVSGDRLIAVSAPKPFDFVNTRDFTTSFLQTVFDTLDIFCFDLTTGAFLWEYDTEMPQSIMFPSIRAIDAVAENEPSLVSVTFEVDNYTFDTDTGELYSAVTLPDSIVMIDQISRESSSFYCRNHKHYRVDHRSGAVTESNGLDPFPEQAKSAFRIGDSIVAVAGENMYWFEEITDRETTGSVPFETDFGMLTTVDCGGDRIAMTIENRLTVVDLKSKEILLTEDLNNDGRHTYWLLEGPLAGRKGALMIGFDYDVNKIHLMAYDSEKNATYALYDSPPISRGDIFEQTNSSLSDSIVYCGGMLYLISDSEKNSILYYNTQTGMEGKIEVTGLPGSMYLAGVYNDFVNGPRVTIPTVTISPDGEYLFSTVYDPSESVMNGAVINLKTGETRLVEPLSDVTGRSRHVVFNDDHSMLAFSTDYNIILTRRESDEPVLIPVDGLAIDSMIWFNHELYVAFSNSLIRCYSEQGDLLSTIKLDDPAENYLGALTYWIPLTDRSLGENMLMYVTRSNMSLISNDHKATTPLLSVPHFIGWSSDSNTLVTIRPASDPDSTDDPDTYTLWFYPYYTYKELINKGKQQLMEMQ